MTGLGFVHTLVRRTENGRAFPALRRTSHACKPSLPLTGGEAFLESIDSPLNDLVTESCDRDRRQNLKHASEKRRLWNKPRKYGEYRNMVDVHPVAISSDQAN